MFVHFYMLIFFLKLCVSADLTYYVEEGKSPDTLVGDIAADTHLMESVPPEDHNRITFSQLQRGATGSYLLFRVSKKSGKLYTTQTLDAESMCHHNTECFRIVDVAVQKGTTPIKILEIKVIIQDMNDHHPEFPDKQINIQFSEGDVTGTKRLIPNAIDRDVGVSNYQITYELNKNLTDPFTLFVYKSVDGTSKLGINLEKKLDREVKDSYMIQVIAKDEGSPPKQSVLDIHISVTDVNDNFPRFTRKVYNVSIKNEPSKTSPVIILTAKDIDSSKNGKLLYYFSSRTSEIAKTHFELNEITGEIFLRKKFMFGQDLVYKLYVEAIDGGSPPLSSVAMVLVTVINQQNHAPTIDINFASTSTENTVGISENIEVGSFIAYVKVTDLDFGENGEVRCDLHHDKFQLQNLGQKKYQVIVKNSLDREKEDHYDITITCQDEGSPPMRSKSKFTIQVLDVNDVKPQFSKKTFQFWIYENMQSKFPVGYINVTDPDLGPGGKLTYSLLTNNKHFLPFQISDDGLISTVMSLDHEFQDIYKFQVLVKDNGIPPQNNLVNVIVKVKDENDNAPYFTFPSINPFTLNVVYFPHHTKNITVLRASDSDSRENAFLKYEVKSGNDKQLFAINHYTGLFSFSRQVTKHDAGSYEMEFVVKDSGSPALSASTTIFLALTVSNKTSEMLNALHIQTDDKIHLNFLIIIVSVAVSVSVIVTVSVSICIIRCNDEIGVTHRGEVISSTKHAQKHLMCSSSHLATSCIDVFVARPTDPDKTRTTQVTELSRVSRPGNELENGHIVTALGIDLQAATDVVYQVSDFINITSYQFYIL